MQEPRPRTKGGEMKRTLFLLSLMLLAINAWAQRVYKCRNGSETIHQSSPCPAEQETGGSRRVVNDPVLTASGQRRNQQCCAMPVHGCRLKPVAVRTLRVRVRSSVPPPTPNAATQQKCVTRWRRFLHAAMSISWPDGPSWHVAHDLVRAAPIGSTDTITCALAQKPDAVPPAPGHTLLGNAAAAAPLPADERPGLSTRCVCFSRPASDRAFPRYLRPG